VATATGKLKWSDALDRNDRPSAQSPPEGHVPSLSPLQLACTEPLRVILMNALATRRHLRFYPAGTTPAFEAKVAVAAVNKTSAQLAERPTRPVHRVESALLQERSYRRFSSMTSTASCPLSSSMERIIVSQERFRASRLWVIAVANVE
jgi:hypothetical protein